MSVQKLKRIMQHWQHWHLSALISGNIELNSIVKLENATLIVSNGLSESDRRKELEVNRNLDVDAPRSQCEVSSFKFGRFELERK